jgi:hypothetical protein
MRRACRSLRSNIQNALTFQDRPWLRIFPYLIGAIRSYGELPDGDAPIFVGQGAFPSCTWLLATTVDYWFLLPLELNPQLHPQNPPLSFVLPLLLSLASFLLFAPLSTFQLRLPSACMELEV